MSDDSETAEDTEKGSLAEVTDDSCTVEYIEIVPLDRASDDYHKHGFIDAVVEVKPEDLLHVKQEPADENDDIVDDRASHYHKLEYIEPVVEVKPEDLQEIKQEPSDEYDTKASFFIVQVSLV